MLLLALGLGQRRLDVVETLAERVVDLGLVLVLGFQLLDLGIRVLLEVAHLAQALAHADQPEGRPDGHVPSEGRERVTEVGHLLRVGPGHEGVAGLRGGDLDVRQELLEGVLVHIVDPLEPLEKLFEVDDELAHVLVGLHIRIGLRIPLLDRRRRRGGDRLGLGDLCRLVSAVPVVQGLAAANVRFDALEEGHFFLLGFTVPVMGSLIFTHILRVKLQARKKREVSPTPFPPLPATLLVAVVVHDLHRHRLRVLEALHHIERGLDDVAGNRNGQRREPVTERLDLALQRGDVGGVLGGRLLHLADPLVVSRHGGADFADSGSEVFDAGAVDHRVPRLERRLFALARVHQVPNVIVLVDGGLDVHLIVSLGFVSTIDDIYLYP